MSPALRSPKKRRVHPLPCAPSFTIVAGSYEKLLYGLSASFAPALTLAPVFIFPAHVSSIRAVAASPTGRWLATGGTDESIKLWDLRRRRELGALVHHHGSITALAFPSRSHLLSASDDGTLALFHTRSWAVLRTLPGHTGPVASVASHPSAKLALSVGRDRTLRMWDLLRGRSAASTKLGAEAEHVCWSPTGTHFAVQTHCTIHLFSTKMTLLHTITHPSRIHSLQFLRRPAAGADTDPTSSTGTTIPSPALDLDLLLVAAEDKRVSIYTLPPTSASAPHIIAELTGHKNRVKAVATITIPAPAPPSSDGPTSSDSLNPARAPRPTTFACTASSDGFIRVFSLDLVLSPQPQPTSPQPTPAPTPAPAPLPPEQSQPQPPSQSSAAPAQSPAPPLPLTIEPLAAYDTRGSRLTCLAVAVAAEAADEGESEGDEGAERDGENVRVGESVTAGRSVAAGGKGSVRGERKRKRAEEDEDAKGEKDVSGGDVFEGLGDVEVDEDEGEGEESAYK